MVFKWWKMLNLQKNLQISNMMSSYWYVESDANMQTNKNLLPQ